MSNRYLGHSFDIHGGGRDLLFPHHENERAQSICANGGDFARLWVHNGFVTVEAEKMSKSLGNFLTIRDALNRYHPEALRLFLLSKHYRGPLDFSKKNILGSHSGLVRIYRTLERLEGVIGPCPKDIKMDPADFVNDPFMEEFAGMMDDDLNTAGAIGLVFEKVREINRAIDSNPNSIDETMHRTLSNDRNRFLYAGQVLGLLRETPEAFFEQLAGTKKEVDPGEIEEMVKARTAARAGKDWAKADEIRDRLKEMGVVLEDGSQGSTWRLDV
jgi:cysteinyl-tRNA synthetase